LFKVLIAPDKFKGSLSAPEVSASVALGLRTVLPDILIDEAPLADGGEGTVEALVSATGGRFETRVVQGPLGDPVDAVFGLLGSGETAVLEMASASGLVLVPPARRDPLRASTFGTGQLLLAALDKGVSKVILGIGGSATNDGGAGLAQALGYRLLDAQGRDLEPGGGVLNRLARIDASGRDPRLSQVEIAVACDVDNPLTGPRGASYVFGPQKFPPDHPPSPETIDRLDRNLAHLSTIIARDLNVEIASIPGSGAAGGLGGGLVAFAGGRLEPGINLVIDAVKLADRLQGVSLCITGEGRLDSQTASGKTVMGVARLARKMGVPTIALAGSIGEGAEDVLNDGISAYFSLCETPMSLDEAMKDASRLLVRVASQALRAFLAGRAGASPRA
jgi:glycerate kinase